MPMLIVKTSLPREQVPEEFNVKATHALSELLKKPVQGFTIVVETNLRITIAGTNEPAAFVELRAIGGLKLPHGTKVVEGLTKIIHEGLGLPTDRFFINLVDLEPEMVGYKGELISATR